MFYLFKIIICMCVFIVIIIISLQNEGYHNNILPDWSSFCQPSKYHILEIHFMYTYTSI